MVQRFFLIVALFISSLYSKECYFGKDDQRICLKRFYNKSQLRDPKVGEKYYIKK